MNFITILGLIGICAMSGISGLVPPPNNAIVIPTPPPPPTLAQDLAEFLPLIDMLNIRQLATRYLLNDAQFQAFVRIINSRDAHTLQLQLRSQPQVLGFLFWVRRQIALSGGELQLEESEEFFSIINRTPFWANSVFGWQGFVNEFQMYYPEAMIRAHADMKIAENGIFAQFMQRLKALKPVYDRIIALPAGQRVIAALNANGIDCLALDTFIRNQFGWQIPPTLAPPSTVVVPVATSTVAGVSASTAAPISAVPPIAVLPDVVPVVSDTPIIDPVPVVSDTPIIDSVPVVSDAAISPVAPIVADVPIADVAAVVAPAA